MNKLMSTLALIQALVVFSISSVNAEEKFIIWLSDGSNVEANFIEDEGDKIKYTTPEGWPGFVSKDLVINVEEIVAETNKTTPSISVEPRIEPVIIESDAQPSIELDVIDAIEEKAKSQLLISKKKAPPEIVNRGHQFMKPGQYNRAEKEWKKIARKYPEDYYAYLQLGLVNIYRDKNHGKAILYFKEAIKNHPKAKDVYFHLATSYKALEDCKTSIDFCNQLLSIDPKDSNTFEVRAQCYEKEGDMAKAIRDYRSAKKYKPSLSDEINRKLAEINVKEGVAFPEIEKDIVFLMARSFSYVADKEFEQAIKDLKSVIKLDPDNDEAYYKLGGIFQSKYKNYKEAVKYFNRAVELDGSNPSYIFARGQAYYLSQMWELAMVDFTEYIAINPIGAGRGYYYRGSCYKNLSQKSQAIEDFLKAKELDPSWAAGADQALSSLK